MAGFHNPIGAFRRKADYNNEDARFCQNCGSVLTVPQNLMAEPIIQLLQDNLFMVLCILYTVSTGFSLINMNAFSIVIGTLMTVFLWLAFSYSKKSSINPKYLRYISGTIFASYIIKWILCCIAIVCGILLAILSLFINAEKLWTIFGLDIGTYLDDYLGIFRFFTNFYLQLLSIVLIVSAIIGIILNVLGWRSIHLFAQSIYRNLEDGHVHLVKCGAAQTWLMVFGVLNAIYAVFDLTGGNLAAFLDGGCLSAALITGSILVRKHFAHHR